MASGRNEHWPGRVLTKREARCGRARGAGALASFCLSSTSETPIPSRPTRFGQPSALECERTRTPRARMEHADIRCAVGIRSPHPSIGYPTDFAQLRPYLHASLKRLKRLSQSDWQDGSGLGQVRGPDSDSSPTSATCLQQARVSELSWPESSHTLIC